MGGDEAGGSPGGRLAHSWTPCGPPTLLQQNPGQVPSAPFPMGGAQVPVL